MHNIVLYSPHLGRDLRPLMEAIPDLSIYEGAKTPKGEDGCLQSHHAVVSWARACELDRVFVLEDDCQFTVHFDYGKWCDDADWAAVNGYDVMVGGCVQTYDPRVVRAWNDVEHMVEVSSFHSAHCLVYFKSGYDKILKTRQPFDTSIGQDVHAKIVMTWPFVAVQTPSFSGILQKDVNYVPLYEQYEDHLGRALGLRL